jgi:hypothetical protein
MITKMGMTIRVINMVKIATISARLRRTFLLLRSLRRPAKKDAVDMIITKIPSKKSMELNKLQKWILN